MFILFRSWFIQIDPLPCFFLCVIWYQSEQLVLSNGNEWGGRQQFFWRRLHDWNAGGSVWKILRRAARANVVDQRVLSIHVSYIDKDENQVSDGWANWSIFNRCNKNFRYSADYQVLWEELQSSIGFIFQFIGIIRYFFVIKDVRPFYWNKLLPRYSFSISGGILTKFGTWSPRTINIWLFY